MINHFKCFYTFCRRICVFYKMRYSLLYTIPIFYSFFCFLIHIRILIRKYSSFHRNYFFYSSK